MSSPPPDSDPTPSSEYSVRFDKSDLINIYVKQWVLRWCQKYHPEAFEEALEFVKKALDGDSSPPKDS